jgi:hypothetical protein
MTNSPRAHAVDPADGPDAAAPSYDEFYFEHYSPRPYKRDEYWLLQLGAVAQRIVETIHPARVLDAGCALGILVETLRQRGIDAEGIDLSAYAIGRAHESVRPYCRVGSIADELPSRYDLIVSIEVLEHLPPDAGKAAVANFCRHTDDVLFSSTPQHYRDATHLNVRPAEYWAELFAEHGLYRDVEFDASFVSPWAARFRRTRDGFPRVIRQYERGYAQLWLERNELRSFANEVEQNLARSIDRVPSLEHDLKLARLQLNAEQAANVEARTALVNAARDLTGARTTLENERHRLNLEAQAGRAAFEADMQRAREDVERERSLIEQELVDVRASLEEIHAQLHQRIVDGDAFASKAASLETELAAARHELALTRGTIHNMEQSFFWRVRKWLRRS